MDGKLLGYVNKISSEKFLQLFDQCSNKPIIGDVSVGEITRLYNELGADGSQILSIHLSDKLSNTYANAKTRCQQVDQPSHRRQQPGDRRRTILSGLGSCQTHCGR